jgi:hypothetical protein
MVDGFTPNYGATVMYSGRAGANIQQSGKKEKVIEGKTLTHKYNELLECSLDFAATGTFYE